MHTVNVNRDRRVRKQVKKLYTRAFPACERLPWWLLRLNARRQGIDLTAYMDGDQLRGFTCSAMVEDCYFLLFFAVAEECRGQGWGSRILADICSRHDRVDLNVELLDQKADNYEQRLRRFAFYRKNGFHDTGYHVWEVGGKFRVLSTTPELNEESYRQVFSLLSGGWWNVRLQKANDRYQY